MAENLVNFLLAAEIAEMKPQNFSYYVTTYKQPPFIEISGRKLWKPSIVKKWAATFRKKKQAKKAGWAK